MTDAEITALLFASGTHPGTRLPLGPPGERCAACTSWPTCQDLGVQAPWRACSRFVRVR